MKFSSKILNLVLVICFFFSCSVLDDDLRINPVTLTPENASLNDLYNSIQLSFEGVFADAQGPAGQVSRMYRLRGFFGELYNLLLGESALGGLWGSAYRDLFPDINILIESANTREDPFDIHQGTAKILQAYTLMALVDLFGDVPYTEAGQGTDIISPGIDPGQQVYHDAVSLLDEAILHLTNANSPPPAFDNFYNGNAAPWIKVANTLKMRAALNMADGAMFGALVAEGNFIANEADDFQWHFGNQRSNPNTRHPFYNSNWGSSSGDSRRNSNYLMWLLIEDKVNAAGETIEDPRLRYYFYRLGPDASCYCSLVSELPPHHLAVDPRLPICTVGNGYWGGDHMNTYRFAVCQDVYDHLVGAISGLYPGGGDFDDDSFDGTYLDNTNTLGTRGGLGAGIWPIMLSSFVDFMRAEAALTLGTGEDPRMLLESGIRKAMDKVVRFEDLVSAKMGSIAPGIDELTVREKFGMDQTDIDHYVTEVLALYDAPGANQLDVVIKEFFIAAYGNGLEAYNMYRRTGLPANMQPPWSEFAGTESDPFPRSFLYPPDEVSRNENLEQKTNLGDPVFWDPMKPLR